MVAFTHCRRWSNWIRRSCLVGLVACLGCNSETPKLPGSDQYDEGCKLLADGNLEKSIQLFDKAIELNPRNAMAACKRAKARQLRGQTDLAIDDYTLALRLRSDSAAVYCSRGAAFLAKGFFDMAIDDLTEAIRLAPNFQEAFYLRARANLAAGRYAEAIDNARAAIRLDTKCGDAFLTLGAAIVSSPDQPPDRATKYFEQAADPGKTLTMVVNAEMAQAYFNRGVNLANAGKRLESEEAFAKAEGLDRKYVQIYANWKATTDKKNDATRVTTKLIRDPKLAYALELLEKKQFDEALDAFTKIVRADPKCADALVWRGRGSAFLEKKDPASAIPDFESAIHLDPNDAEAYCLRGQAYSMMDNCYRAILDTTEAIRLKPEYAEAYFHRAVAYLKRNDSERALADFDHAVKLERRVSTAGPRPDPRSSFGDACVEQGIKNLAGRCWDEAITSFEAAITVDENRAGQAEPLMAQAYAEQGIDHIAARRWDQAIANLEKAIKLDKDRARQLNPQLAQVYGERGFDHAGRREFQEAVSDLDKALDIGGDNARIFRFCGLTCCKQAKDCRDRRPLAEEKEQWEAAIKFLKRAIWLDPRLEYELRRSLEDVQRNLDRISPPARVTATGL